MPEEIAAAFERAFGVDPSKRPSAVEWVAVLEALERRLSRCSVNSMHFYPSSAAGCTWCKMEAASPGAVLFLPSSAQTSSAGVHSGAFDVERAWATIKAVVIPDGRHLLPKQLKPPADASQEARAAKSEPWLGRAFGAAVILGALGLFATYPAGSLFWFVMFGFGFFQMIRSSIDEGAWIKNYKDVDQRWAEAVDQWRERIGIRSLESLRADLEKAVEDFRGLDREKSHAIQRLQNERQSRQLHDYLDRFLIKNAAINGVGPARTMALASYGIESAADVRRDRVLNVPGFGPATTDNLIAWRAGIEKRFVYNPSALPADAQARAQVESQFAVRRNELIKRISEGHRELTQVSASVQQRMQVPEANIATLAERRSQLQVDLQFLGIPQPAPYTLPARATFNPPQNSPAPRPTVSTPPSRHSPNNAGVSCPICGAGMVRRLARQGRRRGQHFWGCSNWPSCTGTRN
jgi:DNA-binding helix-hairpin-helix protein with protein kinase domain